MESSLSPIETAPHVVTPTTMSAAVITAPQTLDIRTVPLPAPAPDEIRVKLDGCGVCASNLPVWQGRPYFDYPFDPGAPGHEGWGRVDAVGADVTRIQPGDRVALLSYHAYAPYDVAPADQVVPLPRELDAVPFPAEPLACAINVFRRAAVEEGDSVAIVGIGFLGSLLTGLCSRAGAEVIAISRRPCALATARRCGAAHTIEMLDHNAIIEQVRNLTAGEGCPVVIEAVGAQWPLDLAAELTSIRGRLVIAGYHQDGPRQVNMQSWNWKGLDVINAHERDPRIYVKGMKEAARAAADGIFPVRELLTHAYLLDELPEAMRDLEQRPDGFLKGWICYD